MAELVVVPELVQELFFLHLGGYLLLLEPGTGALHVEQGVVLLLHGLVGARALALDFQLLLRGGGDGVLYLRGLGAELLYALSARIQLAAGALGPGLHVRKRLRPRLAVAGDALAQQLQLGGGVLRRAALGLQRGELVIHALQLLRRDIELITGRGQLALELLAPCGQLVARLRQFAAAGLQFLQLRAPGEYTRVARRAAARHGAARVDELAVQRHYADAVAVLPRDGHGVRERLRHQRAAQEVFKYIMVSRVKAH